KNLNDEIDQYDHQLGKWLYRYQSNQWQRLIAISEFIHWSSDRYRTYCNSSITSIEFECRLDKFCRYWSDVQRLFGGDGNGHRQSSNDIQFEFNHQKQTLTHQIEQIGIVYRGHQYRCDESIDLLMEKLQNSNEILKIWQECHQQLEYHMIPDLFEKIRKQISGKYFYELWNKVNYDLKIGSIDQIRLKAWTLWNRLKPFYHLLMDYIGHRLREKFNDDDDDNFEQIPAHWLRSLNGAQMDTIIDLIRPYSFGEQHPNDNQINDVIEIVSRFYVEHGGFDPLPEQFWQQSNLIQQSNNGSCHPQTLNMYNNNDVRMNICLQSNNFHYNFRRLFHELGHVYYFFQSNHHHRNLYQMQFNSASHESIGELMRMTWNGCQLHSQRSILPKSLFNQLRINTLMEEALSTLVTIPFGLILEEWRNQTFSTTDNQMTLDDSNDHKSLDDHQQILDPLLKYHVANFQPYWRYVFGVLLQHQFHRKICHNHHSLVECCPRPTDFDPLRKLLRIDLMQPEFSGNDLDIMVKMFDSNDIDYQIEPLLEYYQPLIDWLGEWKQQQQQRQN
ncbi:hypothetical protein DERP_004244, partial [Dermatophagoides pteronyssinus]